MKILIMHSPHVYLAAISNTPINKRFEGLMDQDLLSKVLL